MAKRLDPELLLARDSLDESAAKDLLAPIGFTEPLVAHSRLLAISRDAAHRKALAASLPMLLAALENAATPDSSVMNFERLVQAVPDSLELLQFLTGNPRAVEILIRLFVGSQYLTEILLRNPEYLARLTRGSSSTTTIPAHSTDGPSTTSESPLTFLRRRSRSVV